MVLRRGRRFGLVAVIWPALSAKASSPRIGPVRIAVAVPVAMRGAVPAIAVRGGPLRVGAVAVVLR